MAPKSGNEFDTKCNHCKENFEDNSALKFHLEQFHGRKNDKSKMHCTKKGKCQRGECPKIHVPEKTYHCEQCDWRFYNFNSKTGHINKVHKKKRFHCQKCDKAYAKKRSLTQHDKSVHVDHGPQICKNCHNEYANPYALKKHENKCLLDLSLTQYDPMKHIFDARDGGSGTVGGAGVPKDFGSDDPTLAMLNTSLSGA